jgi:hypothetical protein
MPAFYRHPSDDPKSTNSAYFAVVGPETVFSDADGMKLPSIKDGTSNTILLMEAKRDIPWTKPEDLPYSKDAPLPNLGGFAENGFFAALCDGSVRFMTSPDETLLRSLITSAGGERVQF